MYGQALALRKWSVLAFFNMERRVPGEAKPCHDGLDYLVWIDWQHCQIVSRFVVHIVRELQRYMPLHRFARSCQYIDPCHRRVTNILTQNRRSAARLYFDVKTEGLCRLISRIPILFRDSWPEYVVVPLIKVIRYVTKCCVGEP